MNPVNQQQPETKRLYNNALLTKTTTTTPITSTTTTTLLPLGVTPTTNTNLMKTPLYCAPITINNSNTRSATLIETTTTSNMTSSNSVPMNVITTNCATIPSTLLQMLPTVLPTGRSTLSTNGPTSVLPQVAFINNPIGGQTNLLSQNTATIPINLLVATAGNGSGNNVPASVAIGMTGQAQVQTASTLPAGIAVVHANAPSITGSIIIRNPTQFTAPILQRGSTSATAGPGVGTVPLLNEEMLKQIVVGNAPRTLLKTQIIPQRTVQPQKQLLLTPSRTTTTTTTTTPLQVQQKPTANINASKHLNPAEIVPPNRAEIKAKAIATTTAQSNMSTTTTTVAVVMTANKDTTAANTAVPKTTTAITNATTNSQQNSGKISCETLEVVATVLAAPTPLAEDDVSTKEKQVVAKPTEAPEQLVTAPLIVSDTLKTAIPTDQNPLATVDNATNCLLPTTATTTTPQNGSVNTPTTQMANESPQTFVTTDAIELELEKNVQKPATSQPANQKAITKLWPVAIIVPEPQKAHALATIKELQGKSLLQKASALAEKQESLLKSIKTPQTHKHTLVHTDDSSPRTKRSKSVNDPLNQTKLFHKEDESNLSIERRHSTPAESAVSKKLKRCAAPIRTSMADKSSYKAVDAVRILKADMQKISKITAKIVKAEAKQSILPEVGLVPSQLEEQSPKPKVTELPLIATIKTEKEEYITGNLTPSEEDESKLFVKSDDLPRTPAAAPLKDVPQANAAKPKEVDDTNNNVAQSNMPKTTPAPPKIDLDVSEPMNLLCDEQIVVHSSSGTSSSSFNNSSIELTNNFNTKSSTTTRTKTRNTIAKMPYATLAEPPSEINAYASMLDMLSNFNMLKWKERIGSARGTYMRFQLNEFNLLQIHERCPPRYHINTAYEKPIYERQTLAVHKKEPSNDPLLYLCRRCNCHGPAADFLAPEFCSLECLKRDNRKRPKLESHLMRKHSRKDQHTHTHAQSTLAAPSSILAKKQFRWSNYLNDKFGSVAAPINLFLNPFPTGPNYFHVGMKLEAIDPENCSLFCVCTVRAIQGYRLQLSFDGYEPMYDFWVNADSMDIFPPGWCGKTNRILQPPKNLDPNKFNWAAHLIKEKATPAHRHLFTHLNAAALSSRNPFKIGMHLEAEDLNDTGKLCVATVADLIEERIRVHFDGWDNCYDYWVDISSPYIHPCGWHEGRQQLIVPPEFENYSFNWRDYIRQQGNGVAAHEELFVARDPIDFKLNMKLEVVDPRNPVLIRPATVVGRKGHRIKLHLDGWPSEFCFWMEDDSPDLHPIGWCDATGHDLEPPPGYQMRTVIMPCPTPGCRGIGNAKRFYLNSHAAREACPYTPENWRQKLEKPTRINSDDIVRQAPFTASANWANQKLAEPTPMPMQAQTNNNNNIDETTTQPKKSEHTKEKRLLLERVQQQQQLISKSKNSSCAATTPKQEQADIPMQDTNTEGTNSEEVEVPRSPSESSKTSSSLPSETAQTLLEPTLHIPKQFLCDYGPRLQQNYNLWQKNLAFDRAHLTHNPLQWSTAETSEFVAKTLNCDDTAAAFKSEDVDGLALLMLQQTDLTDMLGLKLGPAVKLFSNILQLRTLAANEPE